MNSFVGILVLSLAIAANALPHGLSRVSGGSDAPAGKYPFQVSIWLTHNFHCGGSIINERYILTAAHCLKGLEAHDITVGFGSHLLNETFNIIKAEKLIWHERFHPMRPVNDIGLIRLAENIVYTEKIQPIKMPTEEFTQINVEVVLVGWGLLNAAGSHPNNLQEIELNVISNEKCPARFEVISKQICTLSGNGKGGCNGDSGGPVVDNGTQIGVVSLGDPCGSGGAGVHTRVFPYLDWIAEKINLQ